MRAGTKVNNNMANWSLIGCIIDRRKMCSWEFSRCDADGGRRETTAKAAKRKVLSA